MKRRVQLFILSAMLVFSLTACGGSASNSADFATSESKSTAAESYYDQPVWMTLKGVPFTINVEGKDTAGNPTSPTYTTNL